MRTRRIRTLEAGRRACAFLQVSFFGSLLVGLFLPYSSAQIQKANAEITWKRVAGSAINHGLAGAASGAVRAAWYAPGAGMLLVQTASGRIFETNDFVHWRLNTAVSSIPAAGSSAPVPISLPEPAARVQAAGARYYAAGLNNLYASEDNGRTWLNLTGFNNRSIIGGGFNAFTISPANPQEIAAANAFGIWRSLDGGLSWHSLNEELPNLTVRKLIGRRTALLQDGTVIAANAGTWTALAGAADPELALRARFSQTSRENVSAAAQSGSTAYAGTSSGRLLVSRDGGATWSPGSFPASAGEKIERIWVDGDRPDVALAAAGSRLFRTVNGGLFWDEVTGSLPASPIHGIAADRSAGIVYVATDRGVFSGSLSLNDAGAAATSWISVSSGLPAAAAWDVRLNSDNTITMVLDGYGVFESASPHRTRNVRIVSGADLSERAAAPGSLISVLGARVEMVNNLGLSYPVLAASDESSQLQVPFEAAAGTYSLTLEGAHDKWSVPLTVKNAAPAIFVDADGAPLILDAASGLVVDSRLAIYAGSVVQLLATGMGKVTPEWRTGVPAPIDSPPAVSGSVSAFLDGRPVEVTRAVLAPAYVGYYLVELRIPAIVNRGASELRIVMNGEESNRVKLYLEPNLPAQ